MFDIHTEIEIAAPPEKVREVVLNFAQYPVWRSPNQGITDISIKPHPTDPSQTKSDPYALVPGDVLVNLLAGKTRFEPVVLVNEPAELKWRGSLPYVFTGDHSFQFHASDVHAGGTRLVNAESFSGALCVAMSSWVLGGATRGTFETFCENVKMRAEGLQGEGSS